MKSIRFLGRVAFATAAIGAMGAAGAGCLDRPVAPATPKTTSRVTERVKQTAVEKIDLLFMIDNSASMADKQSVLADAVPDLVARLVTPNCLDSNGGVVGRSDSNGVCPTGSVAEFKPVKDIHIGIISSSLGGHGADSCSEAQSPNNTQLRDMSHLLDRGLAAGESTYENKHFLFWDPSGKGQPAGEGDSAKLESTFTDMVVGVDQTGCGFEASLESVYRFLVDPNPYDHVAISHSTVDPSSGALVPDAADPPECASVPGGYACLVGTDQTLIQERADFLRPDSLVAVVSLTDENDCSVIDGGQYFFGVQENAGKNRFHLPRGTSACLTDPANKCCVSCGQGAPAGCPSTDPNDPNGDPECKKAAFSDLEDPMNLRCFHQKQRFGIDFLYPIQRYVDGFTQQIAAPRECLYLSQSDYCRTNAVANPLYSDLQGTGQPARDPSLVFWAGIQGVPWQDIAKDPTDLTKGYLSAEELATEGRWKTILGTARDANNPNDLTNYTDPEDPLMIESVDERSGTNPITGAPLVGAAAASSENDNPINGHEWIVTNRDDLQYACKFSLAAGKEKNCAQQTRNCDCGDGVAEKNPLCQQGGTYGTTQWGAKGYPGTRPLAVLKGLGSQAIVASICPSNLGNKAASDYGYRPAIGAIIDRLKVVLKGRCLPRALLSCGPTLDDKGQAVLDADGNKVPNDSCVSGVIEGQVPCVVLEARNLKAGEVCDCTGAARRNPDPATVTSDVLAAGECVCEVTQFSDAAQLNTCQTTKQPAGLDGWCYVDPAQLSGQASIDATKNLIGPDCAGTNEPREIQFVGKGAAVSGSTVFITCQESAFNPSASAGQ